MCNGASFISVQRNPSCPHDPEREKLAVMETSTAIKIGLDQCFESKCDKRTTKL